MLDFTAVRAAFPELTALTPFVQSGQRDVFRGQQANEEIVLKLLRAATAEAEARIAREIEAVAKLGCSYVPRICDYGRRRVGPQDLSFIIEQYTPGETYRERLQRQPVQPLPDVLHLADALLRACCEVKRG